MSEILLASATNTSSKFVINYSFKIFRILFFVDVLSPNVSVVRPRLQLELIRLRPLIVLFSTISEISKCSNVRNRLAMQIVYSILRVRCLFDARLVQYFDGHFQVLHRIEAFSVVNLLDFIHRCRFLRNIAREVFFASKIAVSILQLHR